MKQQVVFIHGAEAFSKYEDFILWLKTMPIDDPTAERQKKWPANLREALGEEYELIAPSMPNKQNAKYEEWKIWFERHFAFLRDDVILIGYSQGGYFLAKYLIENKVPVSIKALFLVAAPFEPDSFDGEDGGDFAFDTTALKDLTTQTKQIYIYHSKDDFVVPFSHAEKYQRALPDATFVTFADRGHFLQETFPELVAQLKGISGH